MRTWHHGAWLLGAITLGCGGGGEEASAPSAPRAQQTTGQEVAVVTVQRPSTSQPQIVEVWESRLPTSAPAGGVAATTPSGAEGEAPSTGEEISDEALLSAATPAGTSASEAAQLEITVDQICPTDIDTLRVRARNVHAGAAIVMTARGADDVGRLRDRMRQFALVHSMEHARQCDGEGDVTVPSSVTSEASPSRVGDPASPLMAVHELRLVEIPNGVRVELRYDDETERASVRELRTRVREDVATMRDGICPLAFQMV